jgi:hypothetical protein
VFPGGCRGKKGCHYGGPNSIKVPVSTWAAASCSWSRGAYINGGSGPRPAVMYSPSTLPRSMRCGEDLPICHRAVNGFVVDDDLPHARGAYRFQATEQRVVRSYAAAVDEG